MPPSLLVVVPTLNSHALLPRLLDSLQQQIWPHWRLLFIDGRHADATTGALARPTVFQPPGLLAGAA